MAVRPPDQRDASVTLDPFLRCRTRSDNRPWFYGADEKMKKSLPSGRLFSALRMRENCGIIEKKDTEFFCQKEKQHGKDPGDL